MKAGLTEIVCIIDKSGSMISMQKDVIGSFNTFVEEQKQLPGEARLSLTTFDTSFSIIESGTPLRDVPLLTEKTYAPFGMTALLDAVGKTVDEVGARLNSTPEDEKPERVIVVIITDGFENSSKEYSLDQIKEKIQTQQDQFKWAFIFFGANQNAFAAAGSMGIAAQSTAVYNSTPEGTRHAFASGIGDNVTNFRATGNSTVKYDKDSKP